MASSKSPSLALPVSRINRDYLLKVYGVDSLGRRINKLVGVSGLIALIGIEMLNKLIARALRCKDDVCHCKLRRGLKISFYNK
ncbi:MAG: ribosomal large subunit pseudouridine synthase B [Bacteroidaceae bacterium]|nr:ribosomal large subunit pseudouridine synthase B [Bacteroidaceae bacterium]